MAQVDRFSLSCWSVFLITVHMLWRDGARASRDLITFGKACNFSFTRWRGVMMCYLALGEENESVMWT